MGLDIEYSIDKLVKEIQNEVNKTLSKKTQTNDIHQNSTNEHSGVASIIINNENINEYLIKKEEKVNNFNLFKNSIFSLIKKK